MLSTSTDQELADLVERSAQANAALMRGDIKRYRELIKITDDFTLVSPFGGTPTYAGEYTPERMDAMGRFFKNGTFEQDLVQAYVSTDMVVLALIERQHVEVGGLLAQDWALRVTLVFRREGTGWHLVHRHADPLSAALAWSKRRLLPVATRLCLIGTRTPPCIGLNLGWCLIAEGLGANGLERVRQGHRATTCRGPLIAQMRKYG